MSDYFDFDGETEDDLDITDEIDEEEEEEDDDITDQTGTFEDTMNLSQFQSRLTTREDTYRQLYNYNDYQTTNFLTKYEYTRILGMRAQEIAKGSQVYVDVGDIKDPIQMAEKEIREGKCPYIIERPIPGKIINKPEMEPRRVSELLLNH
jgi:DNA-directed RNA polymerase subunit K/omega